MNKYICPFIFWTNIVSVNDDYFNFDISYTYFFSTGEALTYLTDRALAWQQRAEKVLRTAEVSEELKKLNDTEANGRKEKKTKGKI